MNHLTFVYQHRPSELEEKTGSDCGDNSDVGIVREGIDVVPSKESICGGKLHPRENFPGNVEVLKEERPASLPAG